MGGAWAVNHVSRGKAKVEFGLLFWGPGELVKQEELISNCRLSAGGGGEAAAAAGEQALPGESTNSGSAAEAACSSRRGLNGLILNCQDVPAG